MSIVYLAADLTTGTVREEIPFFSNVRVTEDLNNVSSFTGQVPLTAGDPNKITKSNLGLGDTILWVLSNGVPIWGGILWDSEVNLDGRTVLFNGLDFLSYFKKRVVGTTLDFVGVDAFVAAGQLLDQLQGQSGGNLGSTLTTVGTPGAVTATFRNDSNHFGYNVLEQLSVDGGFDYTCTWSGNQQNLTHTFELSAPTRGRNTNVVFDVNSPSKRFKNVKSSAWDKVNRAHAVNTSSSERLQVTRSDSGDIASTRLYEGVFTHPELTNRDRMVQAAATDLNANIVNRETVIVEVSAADVDAGLGKLIVGDQVSVKANSGYLDIDRMFRILSKTHNVAASGEITIEYFLQDARLFANVS